jgi:GT2 family glycosyltransferase
MKNMMNEITKQKNEIHETVCAVVVTYNRKNLLIECLDALLKQTRPVDAIYIIDNFSNDGTLDLLKENNYIHELPPINLKEPWEKEFEIKNFTGTTLKIHYVRMHENTGGSGGFYEGVKRGYEKGYDWLWLMDDDAIPYSNSLEILSEYMNNSISALTSTVIDINGNIDISHRGSICKNYLSWKIIPIPEEQYLEENNNINIDIASYVGLLINRNAIKKVGYPLPNMFIFYDDTEHCIRLRNYGSILLIPKSKIKHLAKRGPQYRLSSNWKIYYQYRNRLITIKLHFPKNYLYSFIILIYLKILFSALIGKKTYSKMLLKAVKDYKQFDSNYQR